MTAGVDPRTPCLIGVAQRTWRPGGGGEVAPEPLDMWEEVVRAAAADAKATRGPDAVLESAGSLQVVYCQSWQYDDAPRRLADRLSITPPHTLYSGIGGTTPQQLLDGAATAILDGSLDVAVITGAEALSTLRTLKKAGQKPAWSFKDPQRKPFPYEAPFHPAEVAHEVFQAWLTFALFDVARRAHSGLTPSEHRESLGRLLSSMTDVAAANPHAWFPSTASAAELIAPTADNRIVGYPYTKRMVAVMDVDMASALVLASTAAADELGVPLDRRVHLRGWGYATDPVYVAEHPQLWTSPAMRRASSAALSSAGVGIDDVAHLDLYSCFGSSLSFALDALGMAPDDARGVTVTGGLPYAGGPASNYVGHSVATMVDVLRNDPGSAGLVSGVGMHMTKHVYGVYSTTPAPVVPPEDPGAYDGPEAVPITDTASGEATIATYSVVHDRDGSLSWGLAVCDLPDGTRAYARVEDVDVLAAMEADEWVGTPVTLTTDGKVNRLTPA